MLNVEFGMKKSFRAKGCVLLCVSIAPFWFKILRFPQFVLLRLCGLLNRYKFPQGLFAILFCFYFCNMLAHEYIFLISTLAMDAR